MAQIHDRASRSLASSSREQSRDLPTDAGAGAELPILCQESGTDPLSDVLHMVKLSEISQMDLPKHRKR